MDEGGGVLELLTTVSIIDRIVPGPCLEHNDGVEVSVEGAEEPFQPVWAGWQQLLVARDVPALRTQQHVTKPLKQHVTVSS